jgi:anti-anti-sigma factor
MDNGTRIPAVRVGSWAMVVLPVEIDSCCADVVSSGLAAALGEGTSVVVADLSGTGFCDSSGVRALVAFHKLAVAHGTEVRLVVPSPAVLRIFELMGADQVLSVYATLGSAMAGAPGDE